MRVYLPATVPLLAAWLARGGAPSGLTAFAVTPGLSEWYVEGDPEELEYAATTLAARASLRLLASDPRAPRRRVVVAADVSDPDVVPLDEAERGAVRLAVGLPVATWAAGLLDGDDARPAVAAAAESVDAADLGDADAELAVGDAEDADLLWFATQELPDLG